MANTWQTHIWPIHGKSKHVPYMEINKHPISGPDMEFVSSLLIKWADMT